MEENSLGQEERSKGEEGSDNAESVASNAESFRRKCADLWDDTESKGGGSRSSSRSKSSRSRSVSRSVSSRSSRSNSSRSSIKSRSSVISRSSSKSLSIKNCDATVNESNLVVQEKEEDGPVCDKNKVDKEPSSVNYNDEAVDLEKDSELEEGKEDSFNVEDLKMDETGPSLIDTFDVKDGPPEPHYDIEEDEQIFTSVNPMDHVMKDDDDPKCPKDIEIPYDDRDGEAIRAAMESLGNKVTGGTLSFGQKLLQVKLPNFKYKAKHLNKTGGFAVNQLKCSHPSFFCKPKQTK